MPPSRGRGRVTSEEDTYAGSTSPRAAGSSVRLPRWDENTYTLGRGRGVGWGRQCCIFLIVFVPAMLIWIRVRHGDWLDVMFSPAVARTAVRPHSNTWSLERGEAGSMNAPTEDDTIVDKSIAERQRRRRRRVSDRKGPRRRERRDSKPEPVEESALPVPFEHEKAGEDALPVREKEAAPAPSSTPEPASPSPAAAQDGLRPGNWSKLARAAAAAGIRVPDVTRRVRTGATSAAQGVPGEAGLRAIRSKRLCPPLDVLPGFEGMAEDAEQRVPCTHAAREAAEAGEFKQRVRDGTPSLEELGRMRVALVTISTGTPKSLRHAVRTWKESGLLSLVDEPIMWLNAPTDEEIRIGEEHGFRVIALTPERLAELRAAHDSKVPQFDQNPRPLPEWPFVQKRPDGRISLWVAPAQWYAYQEATADVILFLEKDFAIPPHVQKPELIRYLLAGVASLYMDASVIRLRRYDDASRAGLSNCCAGECGSGFSDFKSTCVWHSHLDWLSWFCRANDVEGNSNGQVQECLDERGDLPASLLAPDGKGYVGGIDYSSYYVPTGAALHQLQALQAGKDVAVHIDAKDPSPTFHVDPTLLRVTPEPLRMFCTGFGSSQWSNNPAMFRREWWLAVLGVTATYTSDGNGMFEVNTVAGLCKQNNMKPGRGSGPQGDLGPRVCQLLPGLFTEVEIDG